MRVVDLTVFVARVPLRRAIRHASHRRTTTDNLVVRCRLDDGTVGWGEGVPREYVTGETAERAVALLTGSDIAGQLESVNDFPSAVRMAERLQIRRPADDVRGIVGNAARCAVELTVLDAFGRAFGQPLSAVAAIVTPDCHSPSAMVRYSGVIASADGWKMRLAAAAMRWYGFRQIKVKVGIDGQDDARRLKLFRRWAGPRVELRLDVNEAWSPANGISRLKPLLTHGLTSVEQPYPVGEERHLRSLGVPVILDESLCGMNDAERAVAENWGAGWNLRLSKCGGLIPTLRLYRFARTNNIACQLGCQVGETAILSAAGRAFATSVGPLTAVEGSFDRHLVRDRFSLEDVTFGRGGLAPALTGPGLGVTIDANAVERIAVRREVLIG